MAKTIKIDSIGELIGEKPYHINWFNYNLGSGWGFSINNKSSRNRNRGSVIQGINKDTSVQQVIKAVENDDFDKIAGFYPAIFLFFGEKFIDKVDFCDGSSRNRISRLIDSLKGPAHLEEKIRDFIKQDFDFIAFLEACGRNEKLNFDVNSAISVYKLQGDGAIYGILCQIFYVNKGYDGLSVNLIDDLPVDLPIDVSNYVSGCHFPVAVSPAVSEFKWQKNQNGDFLYGKWGDEWCVVDVVSSGFVNLSNYSLANRLNYLGGGGKTLPYVICWNWGEIIELYQHFKPKMLIRDLRNTIFNHYWFNFGLDSYINVEFKENLVNKGSQYAFSINIDKDIPTDSSYCITVQLDGKFVKYCDKKDICFSKSEIFDWFELTSLLE